MSGLALMDATNRIIPHKIPKDKLLSLQKHIFYSDKYTDDEYEYRHVMVPKEIAKHVPKTHLMSESEWRSIGIQQSQGWIHFMKHNPEPHVLLFRRMLPKTKADS